MDAVFTEIHKTAHDILDFIRSLCQILCLDCNGLFGRSPTPGRCTDDVVSVTELVSMGSFIEAAAGIIIDCNIALFFINGQFPCLFIHHIKPGYIKTSLSVNDPDISVFLSCHRIFIKQQTGIIQTFDRTGRIVQAVSLPWTGCLICHTQNSIFCFHTILHIDKKIEFFQFLTVPQTGSPGSLVIDIISLFQCKALIIICEPESILFRECITFVFPVHQILRAHDRTCRKQMHTGRRHVISVTYADNIIIRIISKHKRVGKCSITIVRCPCKSICRKQKNHCENKSQN